MAVRNYFSVEGQVRSEKGANGYLYYARDNVGSVSSTHDTSGAVYNTYSYNPYGGVSKGAGPFYINRRFLWCGSWGYSYINKTAQWLSFYVRARHYSALQCMWTTRDPLWPEEPGWQYSSLNPTTHIDPTGTVCEKPKTQGRHDINKSCQGCFSHLKKTLGKYPDLEAAKQCFYKGKPCNAPKQLSSEWILCLQIKEASLGGSGDVGKSAFNMKPDTIRQLCKESRACFVRSIGLSNRGAVSVESCATEIGASNTLLTRLAVLMMSCWGRQAYGYRNPLYKNLFDRCETCMEKAMTSNPPSGIEPGCKSGWPDCYSCVKGLEQDQHSINYKLPFPDRESTGWRVPE